MKKLPFILISFLLLLSCTEILAQEGYSSGSVSQQRRQARTNQIPTTKEVVVEEYMNFHRHNIPRPSGNKNVNLDMRWGNDQHQASFPQALLQIGITTALLETNKNIAPLNIALVMDCSGSMADGNRIPKVRQALTTLIRQLRPQDVVSLIGFHDDATVFFPAQMIESKNAIMGTIEQIRPIGSTNINAGLQAGYVEVMKNMDKKDKKNYTHRVLLLTDGMANVGVTDPQEIAKNSKKYNEKGISLSVIGVGDGVQTDMLRTLAEAGRGQVHFVGDNEDLEKVFVSELQSLLSPVAKDASISINYNTKKLKLSEFFGYSKAKISEGNITLPLDDMNKGLTQILMLAFVPTNRTNKNEETDVEATITYTDFEQKKEVEIHKKITIYLNSKKEFITASTEKDTYIARYEMLEQQNKTQFQDKELTRNYVITRLAQSIKDIATLNQDYEEEEGKSTAKYLAQNSLKLCQNLTPDYQNDADIKRIYDILEKYMKML